MTSELFDNSEPINYKFNSLDDTHPKDENVNGLKIDLMNHQKTALYHASLLEKNNGTNFNGTYIFSVFGILACKVGSGKSFVVLSLILKQPLINFNRIMAGYGSISYSSFKRINTISDTVKTNIILIPHNLFTQWKEYITKNTCLRLICISSTKEYNIFKEKITEYESSSEIDKKDKIFEELTDDIVYLITNKNWNNFAYNWTTVIKKNVSRIFIDEVHAIHIPNSMKIQSNFTWFITSSLNDIYRHSNYGFIREFVNSTYHNISEIQIIKNKDDYIDSSIKLQNPNHIVITCMASRLLRIFSGIITTEIRNMLLAEDIQGVISSLGITTIDESNIISILCKNLNNELENAKMIHETKKLMHYNTDQIKEETLLKSQEKIDKLQEKINDVRQRINDNNLDPIMHTDIENPVITPCCTNKFDFKTITAYYSYQEESRKVTVCPMCRAPLDIQKLIYVGKFNQVENQEQDESKKEWDQTKHNKIDNLENILKTKISIDKRILIFSQHEGNLSTISNAFKNAGRLNLEPVKGSINHIQNLIEQYNNGSIPNLFLNASYCGSGLNLEKTDVVIIMHKMSPDNLNQVIGRAQRLGRKTKLDIYYLYAKNE
jgi:hypothetical protein